MPTQKERIDSLWRLQLLTDSTNMIVLNKIINTRGWPGANQLGDHYCQRPAANVTILIVHLGTRKRDYQITTLKNVIALCEKHEESWGNAETLIRNLHSRFRGDFSEFSFLEIKNNHILMMESFFSLYTMCDLLMSNPADKIEIKCRKRELFNELKSAMLLVNPSNQLSEAQVKVYKKLNMQLPKALDESCFEFVEAPGLNDNVVLYKFSKK